MSEWTFSTAFTRLVRSPYTDWDSESLPIYICVCTCVCLKGRKRGRKERKEPERKNPIRQILIKGLIHLIRQIMRAAKHMDVLNDL